MNEVLNNIYTRRSIRKFKEQDVPKDLVDEIVKAGTYAPSGKNLQTYRFYVMQNADSIKSLQDVVAKGMENPAYTLYGARQLYLLHVRKKLSTESATAHARLKICFLQHTHLDLVHAGSTS